MEKEENTPKNSNIVTNFEKLDSQSLSSKKEQKNSSEEMENNINKENNEEDYKNKNSERVYINLNTEQISSKDNFIEDKDPNQNKFQNQSELIPPGSDVTNKNNVNKNSEPQKKTQRKFYVNLEKESEPVKQPENFCNNVIRTSQYNLITFLPLALLNQFKTAFNIFFLLYTIVVAIPSISPVEPVSNIIPFIVVLIISLIREAIEDYRKYRNDKKANETKVLIYKNKKFQKDQCRNIQIGNIIKISKDEMIPADVLIIKTSLENGFCYMQTTNLDGENALKPREALTYTHLKINNKSKMMTNLFSHKNDNCFIEVDLPSKNIYKIEGTAFFNNNERFYFDIKNTLLRGTRLKNVDYAYGIVIYSGKDTKLMQNINRSSLKMSTLDKKLNILVIMILILTIVISLICALLGFNFRQKNLPDYKNGHLKADYLFYYHEGEKGKNSLEIARIFAGNFIIFNTLIPVSVVIVNAVIKVLETIVLELLSPQYRRDPDDQIKCFSTTLIEEMGMVKYIFSDKTGTLTKNEMSFKACSIFSELFEDLNNNKELVNKNSIVGDLSNMPFPNFSSSTKINDFNFSNKVNISSIINNNNIINNISNSPQRNFTSRVSDDFGLQFFLNYLKNKNIPINISNVKGCPFSNQYDAIQQFFLDIILNHDVLAEENEETKEINFQGSNPDEVTLVSAANEFGFIFVSRENKIITIEILDHQTGSKKQKKFEVLQKFDFSSERQRSSIIVKDSETKKIILYLKGSDRKVFSLLDEYSKENIFPKTKQHTDNFARQGLRTLCYGFKYLSESDYNKWNKEYSDTKYKCINDKSLYPQLDLLIEEIEKNETLLGVSALEDKLQDEVKNNIQNFIEAGINFWMITGDKMDTAESIGYSCGIFSEDTEVYKIKETHDVDEVIQNMRDICDKIDKSNQELNEITKSHRNKKNLEDNEENIINEADEEQFEDRKICQDVNTKKIISPNNDNNNNNNKNINKAKINVIDSNDDIINGNQEVIHISPKKGNNKSDNKNINLNKAKTNKQEDIESKASANDNDIFNYVVKNIQDNEYKYDDISSIQSQIKQISESAGSEIDKNSCKEESKNASQNNLEIKINEINSSDQNKSKKAQSPSQNSDELFRNIDNIRKNESKIKLKNKDEGSRQIMKKHKSIDIPTEENNFKEYFDYCQNELYKCSLKNNKKMAFLKIKYIYPQIEENDNQKKISSKFSLIIEGSSINSCMTKGEAAELFWSLIKRSRSLICCRASPSQKSQIVEFIKKRTDSITLAIGDGGNDVNMIKMSHVGIGLFGKEGYQAAYNSDYAISQFKYLKDLLFVEGRFSLGRNSYFNYKYFFKNVLFTIPQLWLAIYSGFSGGFLFDDWYVSMFNTFITLFGVSLRAILEEDFDITFSKFKEKERKFLKYLIPDIYKEHRDSLPFNLPKFIFLFILAGGLSAILYYVPVYSFQNCSMGTSGKEHSFWDSSFTCFISVCFVHFYIIYHDTLYWNRLVIIVCLLQILVDLLFLIVFNALNYETGMDDTMWYIMSNLNFWLGIIITCSIVCVPFYILRMTEFFFGGFIVNMIKQKKYKRFYIRKFYQKKIDQMTRVILSVAKFKKIYRNTDKNKQLDNLADKQMKIIIDEFKVKRKSSKKVINVNDNLNKKYNKNVLKINNNEEIKNKEVFLYKRDLIKREKE